MMTTKRSSSRCAASASCSRDSKHVDRCAQFTKRVRDNLLSLRALALACRRRESRKLFQQEMIQRIISHNLLLNQPHMRMAFEMITMCVDRCRQGLARSLMVVQA